MAERGQWLTDMNGDRRWYASPERERCGGNGYMHCYCGGDFCCCGNGGEIECYGCEDCERDDDYDDIPPVTPEANDVQK